MKPLFTAQLVNDPFGDPGLYIDFLFEKRAFLFDLGDIHALSPRHLLRVSDVFVTHTHMDHFYGFDHLLRVLLGRDKIVHLYGPPGLIANVEGRIQGYTWNLIDTAREVLDLRVYEWDGGRVLEGAAFSSRHRFQKRPLADVALEENILHRSGGVTVRAALFDHKIPVVGLRLDEPRHVNICPNQLQEMGLEPGSWLKKLKEAIYQNLPPETSIELPSGEMRPLGELKEKIVRITPGWSIGYLTDLIYSERNIETAEELFQGVHTLFIEARFAHRELELAREHHHLTTWQAGDIARRVGARKVVPFHFSPRYHGLEAQHRWEVECGFQGGPPEEACRERVL